VAIASAKSNAKRLREQDGGTLDLHRQSLRQHGLLHDRHSVSPHTSPVGGVKVPMEPTTSEVNARAHEEAIKAESRRRKEEARLKELDEWNKAHKENNSLWNWIRGK
jgi:hypothetical protein